MQLVAQLLAIDSVALTALLVGVAYSVCKILGMGALVLGPAIVIAHFS